MILLSALSLSKDEEAKLLPATANFRDEIGFVSITRGHIGEDFFV